MLALRFVHHDLYPRNLLVAPADAPRRVVFLDAWAGGPAPQWRGPAYDLACFFLEGAELLTRGEQESFLDAYFAERAAQDRPVTRHALLHVARCDRAALRRQLERDPARLRGAPLPRADWPAAAP
jgi:aminoglycoside/choline kinase family phosphotransferase